MNPMQRLVSGLIVLRAYDNTNGRTYVTITRKIVAGPSGPMTDSIPPRDREYLAHLGWQFASDLGRWCFDPAIE